MTKSSRTHMVRMKFSEAGGHRLQRVTCGASWPRRALCEPLLGEGRPRGQLFSMKSRRTGLEDQGCGTNLPLGKSKVVHASNRKAFLCLLHASHLGHHPSVTFCLSRFYPPPKTYSRPCPSITQGSGMAPSPELWFVCSLSHSSLNIPEVNIFSTNSHIS